MGARQWIKILGNLGELPKKSFKARINKKTTLKLFSDLALVFLTNFM